jgi:hypothetical protein
MLLLVLSLITISSVELNFKLSSSSDVDIGLNAIYNAYMRHTLLADVIFYCRMLNLLGKDIYIPRKDDTKESVENELKTNVIDSIIRVVIRIC